MQPPPPVPTPLPTGMYGTLQPMAPGATILGAPAVGVPQQGGPGGAGKVTVARPVNRFPPRELESSAVRTEQSKIFVCFLPARFSEEELRSLFEKFGKVRSVNYSEATHSGSLQFVSCFAASKAAKEMDNVNVGSNRIQVKLALRRTDSINDVDAGFTNSNGSVSSNGPAPPAYNSLTPPLPPAGSGFVNTAPAYLGGQGIPASQPTALQAAQQQVALLQAQQAASALAAGQAAAAAAAQKPPQQQQQVLQQQQAPNVTVIHHTLQQQQQPQQMSMQQGPGAGSMQQLDACKLIRIRENGQLVNVVFIPQVPADGHTTMYVTQGANGSQQVLATVPGTGVAAPTAQTTAQLQPQAGSPGAVGGVSMAMLAQLASLSNLQQAQPPQAQQQRGALPQGLPQQQQLQPTQQQLVSLQPQLLQPGLALQQGILPQQTQDQRQGPLSPSLQAPALDPGDLLRLQQQIAAAQAAQGGPAGQQQPGAVQLPTALNVPAGQTQVVGIPPPLPGQQDAGGPLGQLQSASSEFVNSTGSQGSHASNSTGGGAMQSPHHTLMLGQAPPAAIPGYTQPSLQPQQLAGSVASIPAVPGSEGIVQPVKNSPGSAKSTPIQQVTAPMGNVHVPPPMAPMQPGQSPQQPTAQAQPQQQQIQQFQLPAPHQQQQQQPDSQVSASPDSRIEESRIQDMLNQLDGDDGFTTTC